MSDRIDWRALSAAYGRVHAVGESASTRDARRALESVLGRESLRDAVDFYCSHAPGSELVRQILNLLQPYPSMERCYEIFCSEEIQEKREAAVELLRVVADERALQWVREFLDDDNERVQAWGIGVLDQLLWKEIVSEEDVKDLLARSKDHPNVEVRGTYAFIKKYLTDREL